jgi:hypothetical protein
LEARLEQRGDKASALHPTLRKLHLALTPVVECGVSHEHENPETAASVDIGAISYRARCTEACKNLGRMPMIYADAGPAGRSSGSPCARAREIGAFSYFADAADPASVFSSLQMEQLHTCSP